MDGFAEALGQEVELEFTRSMNRILLDRTVAAQPGLFPTVTLPDPHVEIVPKTGVCNWTYSVVPSVCAIANSSLAPRVSCHCNVRCTLNN